MFDYAANAACPTLPSWQISEVGYDWARIVFRPDRLKGGGKKVFYAVKPNAGIKDITVERPFIIPRGV